MNWTRRKQIGLMRRRGVVRLGEEPVGRIERWATDILKRDAKLRASQAKQKQVGSSGEAMSRSRAEAARRGAEKNPLLSADGLPSLANRIVAYFAG
jgi:hypothetical protein